MGWCRQFAHGHIVENEGACPERARIFTELRKEEKAAAEARLGLACPLQKELQLAVA